MDFIDDAISWFKSLFSSEEDMPKKPKQGQKKKKEEPKIAAPEYAKKPYSERTQPNLDNIPADLAKFIVRWFVSSGMSLEGAAATAGNLWRESFMNPTQLQIVSGKPKGPGRGLAQWQDSTLTKDTIDDGKGRWDHYEKEFFPKLKASHEFWKDHVLDDLEPQLAYVVYEMRTGFPGVWRNMTSSGSVSQKTIDVLKKYEISKDRESKEEQNYRASLAEKIYTIAKEDEKLTALLASRKEKK